MISENLDIITAPVRRITAKVELVNSTNAFTHDGDLISFTVDRVGEAKFFGFGVCQKANIKLRDVERKYSFTTSEQFRVSIDNLCTFPLFTVTEVNRDETTNALSITAYDALEKAGAHTVSEITLGSYTIGEFAQACGALLGVEVVLPALDAFSLYYDGGANFDGAESIREALNDVAEATQTIYFINYENKLVFKRLDKDGAAALIIDKAQYFTLDSKTNRRLTGICSATELGDNVSAVMEQSGTTQYIRDNAFYTMRDDIADLVNGALEALGGFAINQFNCNWRGNYLLEIGDKIGLITKDDETLHTYLLNDTISYDGSLTQDSEWEYEDTEESESNPTNLGEAIMQTFARVDKANKRIDIVAGESNANTEAITALQLNTGSISASVSTIEERLNETLDGVNTDVEELKKKVEATITEEQLEVKISNSLSNGVSKVETSTGFVFDDTGLTVSKSNSEITTQITENGMTVSNNGEEVLTANNDGVKAVDLHATTYLIIGKNSRFEDYGSNRTACFWIGG